MDPTTSSPLQTALLKHFREQAGWCEAFGSPFTAQLIARMGDDLQAGGPVADLVANWQEHPRASAVSLRLAGALHAAVLQGRDSALAAQYPSQRPDWNMDTLWPHARAFLVREHAWVAHFLRSAPQTNEVRRAIVLLLGFLSLAHEYALPLDTYEFGASAGLNSCWDRFGYRTPSWSWGADDGVLLDTDWSGPPPQLDASVTVRSRAACDLNPLDVRDRAQRLQLRSYVWADQAPRLARFDAAVALANALGVHVERADAAHWLGQRLAQRTPGGLAVVYHSVFWQYPPPEGRAAIEAAITAAGERATRDTPLAWLRMEPEALLGGPRDSIRLLLDLTVWPGGARRVLAITDGHARSVEVVPQV